MKPCGYCHRHILASSHECPFCGRRPRAVDAGLKLSLVLGLTLAGCTDGSGSTSSGTTTENPTAGGETVEQGDTTVNAQDDVDDAGASYYAGPAATGTTWYETTTDGSSGSSTTDGETDTQGTSSSDGGSSSDDQGASYYAGPSSSSGTWGFNEHRTSSTDEEDQLA